MVGTQAVDVGIAEQVSHGISHVNLLRSLPVRAFTQIRNTLAHNHPMLSRIIDDVLFGMGTLESPGAHAVVNTSLSRLPHPVHRLVEGENISTHRLMTHAFIVASISFFIHKRWFCTDHYSCSQKAESCTQ